MQYPQTNFVKRSIIILITTWLISGSVAATKKNKDEPPSAMQAPPILENPLVVSNYDNYGTGSTRLINGQGGDVLLLAHAPNGQPQVLKNVRLNIANFRRLHIQGLDIELDDPSFPESRVINLTTGGSGGRPLIEEIFIEGMRIENHFIQDNADALAMYWLGTLEAPVNRLVIQNSRITGVGIAGRDDSNGVHPDIMQFQAEVFIKDVYIENFTGTTMYQGIFAPWDDANSPAIGATSAPNWHLKDVNISSEDYSTNRLLVFQNEGGSVADFPVTSFENVYLSQGQSHSYGVGGAVVHVDPTLFDDSPYEFVSAARITGVPTPGVSSFDFAPRDEVGIYYTSPY